MVYPDAAPTPRHHFTVVRFVVNDGWLVSEVAARFHASLADRKALS